MNRIPILSVIALLLCFALQPVHISAQDNFPKPISKTAEIVEPGKAVFLSYPKYYRNAEDDLVPVDTTLRPASDTEWDYEVTTGIWQLKVKTDGTFQAQHEGDTFTYRFQNLGIGRGSQFRGVDLGEPDFSNYQVNGDTIRWTNVFTDVDLTLRYINDIMKVDVIVKQAFMDDLRAEVNAGSLRPDEFLTARFEIPNVFITSQAKQGDQPRDLYGAPVDLGNRPLYFERDGKVVHKLRPVESYVLDDQGKRNDSGVNNSIQTAQRWQLKQGGGGFAEMSANIGDLANAPEGDVVIDPSTTFDNPAQDTLIFQGQTSPRGSNSTETWAFGNTSGGPMDDRLLFTFNTTAAEMFNSVITSAELEIWETWRSSQSSNPKARAHKITTTWFESSAEWDTPWTNNGGDFIEDGFYSDPVDLPSSANQWMKFDVTQALRSHLYEADQDGVNPRLYALRRGFMIKGDTSTTGIYTVAMDEYGTTDKRPKLTVNYQFTQFGADIGEPHNNVRAVATRETNMANDGLSHFRIFAASAPVKDGGDPLGDIMNDDFFANISSNARGIIVFGALDFKNANYSAQQYADYVELVLTKSNVNAAIGNELIGIELGNEEAQGNGSWDDPPITDFWAGGFDGGQNYAEYYLAAYNEIDDNPNIDVDQLDIFCSSTFDASYAWGWTSQSNSGSSPEFMEGFIDGVINGHGGQVGGYDKLPDVVQVHNYAMESPEFDINTNRDPGEDFTEWFDRLDQMANFFNTEGYMPAFAQTEYGYSPRESFNHAPFQGTSPSVVHEASHAIYYLRSKLITGLERINGLGWKYDMYYHHPNDFNTVETDYGFYIDESGGGGIGSRRMIGEAAEILHTNVENLEFGDIDSYVWGSVQREKPSSSNGNIGYAWGGWKTSTGKKWGTIWRYRHTLVYSNQIAVDSENFIVGGDLTGYTVKVHKMDFSGAPVQLVQETSISVTSSHYNSSELQTEIPIDTDQNPRFLEFIP